MRLTALILIATVAGAFAACPNQCSGHGRCTEYDRCECFKQTGTTWRQRLGWTGADCSRRTCPLGIAFDSLSTVDEDSKLSAVAFDMGTDFSGNANSNNEPVLKFYVRNYQFDDTRSFVVRVTDVGTQTLSYQWKLSSQDSYSNAVTISLTGATKCTKMNPCELTSNGMLSNGKTTTGVYVYATALETGKYAAGNKYTLTVNSLEERAYVASDPNTAHQQVECSGRGSCDSSTGRCDCFDGYSGEACQRTSCPSDCSGHGVCQDVRRFASDASDAGISGASYTAAFDARKEMGCKCDDGFRGPDCSLIECPSGADPMGGYGGNGMNSAGKTGPAMDCSGRGICDYSEGTCTCFKGFFGERCEHQTNFV